MGIFDRFRHKADETTDPAERAALAHDEAADAYSSDVERTRETAQRRAQERKAQEEADRQAAENMTSEGDPWG
jgi:broad specificity phosphatase PhoE